MLRPVAATGWHALSHLVGGLGASTSCGWRSSRVFLLFRDFAWLFLHQVATSVSALLLLLAALQLSQGYVVPYLARGDRPHRVRPLVVADDLRDAQHGSGRYHRHAAAVGGDDLDRHRLLARSAGGALRRRAGAEVGASFCGACIISTTRCSASSAPLCCFGVFSDVLFLFTIGLGMLFLALGAERRKLAIRSGELEQLTRLLLRAQEDERKRPVARTARRGRAGADRGEDRARSRRADRGQCAGGAGHGAGARHQQPAASAGSRRSRPDGRVEEFWSTTSRDTPRSSSCSMPTPRAAGFRPRWKS